jgi:hypothetical protein
MFIAIIGLMDPLIPHKPGFYGPFDTKEDVDMFVSDNYQLLSDRHITFDGDWWHCIELTSPELLPIVQQILAEPRSNSRCWWTIFENSGWPRFGYKPSFPQMRSHIDFALDQNLITLKEAESMRDEVVAPRKKLATVKKMLQVLSKKLEVPFPKSVSDQASLVRAALCSNAITIHEFNKLWTAIN